MDVPPVRVYLNTAGINERPVSPQLLYHRASPDERGTAHEGDKAEVKSLQIW
jgi:hypothetical protein